MAEFYIIYGITAIRRNIVSNPCLFNNIKQNYIDFQSDSCIFP